MTTPNNPEFMFRCLELAAKWLGKTRSNPLVGAVIIHKNKIIGEGYHHEFGGPHAEDLAIRSVQDKRKLKESEMYVNLEPCNHFGKTPPCSMLIKDHGIPKVIIGSIDPNPLVSGRGIEFLRKSGLEVITGVYEEKCRFLNRRFNTFHEKKRPYIILKWAQTLDGYLDNRETGDTMNIPLKITESLSRILVHKWRTEEMAIMAGTNTMNMDNPSLTARFWDGADPVRISFERNTPLRKDLNILNDGNRTIIYTKNKEFINNNLEYRIPPEGLFTPDAIMNDLFHLKILSVIIEGGSILLKTFLDNNLWDEARIFTGQKTTGNGTKAPRFTEDGIKYKSGNDELLTVIRKNY